jgi:DNA-binding XRE family transcriptional regulator
MHKPNNCKPWRRWLMADKRRTRRDPEKERQLRVDLFTALSAGEMTLGQAVAAMRRLSRLTQPEFAKHRGISVQSLRQIESDTGNPTVETLNKIGAFFGLQVGFVRQPMHQTAPHTLAA